MSDTSVPVGLGIGLIAAAVAATARIPGSVATLGLEGVVVAFRLAIELQRASRDIQESDGTWARMVSSYTLEEAQQHLDKVNGTLRPLHHAYVGQVLPGSLVLFGPPLTLETLAKSSNLAQSITSTPTSSKCLLYGSHLPPVDTAKILRISSVHEACIIQRSLYSAHSPAGSLSAGTFGELLRLIVTEIAQKSMQVVETFRTVATALQKRRGSEVILTTVGSIWDASAFQDILHHHDQNVRIGKFSPCPKPFGDDLSSIPSDAIAIVGMSGRFPESDTLDELWRLLETGTTTHQEIPSSRFNVDDFYDPSRKKHNALVSQHRCFIKKPGDFDSRILIMDMVLPTPGSGSTTLEAALRQKDLTMLHNFNAKEREVEDWRSVLQKADPRLEIKAIRRPDGSHHSVIEVVLRQDAGMNLLNGYHENGTLSTV